MGQPVVHFEIGCQNRESIAGFYADLFGWQTTEAGPATLIQTGSANGIQGHITALGHEPHKYVLVYIEVPELSVCLEHATSLGGKVVIPPIPLPDGRQFAWLSDPDGNTLGIITPTP